MPSLSDLAWAATGWIVGNACLLGGLTALVAWQDSNAKKQRRRDKLDWPGWQRYEARKRERSELAN